MKEPLMRMWNLSVTIDPKEHGLMPIDLHEAAIKAEREHCARAETVNLERGAKIATLERDLAAANEQAAHWRKVAARPEASPAILRVVEAAREDREVYRRNPHAFSPDKTLMAVYDAVDALEALAAPAVEEPLERWLVVGSGGDAGHWYAERGGVKHGPFTFRTCGAVVDCLNAEAAR